jgi:hypothetical protein
MAKPRSDRSQAAKMAVMEFCGDFGSLKGALEIDRYIGWGMTFFVK